ncbi:hypothetical protein MHU86_2303 [Fragilaria crotonensis]|nr:hypothetical protein MHU86_2303 [Fragilaria crotonensis]
MNEPEFHRRLEAVDTNANANNANVNDSSSAPAAKKAKGAARILTFSVSHSPVQVQVLSTQTLYDLVDIICRETTIGRNESADAHMWNIRLLPGRRVYESGDFPCQSERRANRTMLSDLALVPKTTTMILNYDYGDDLEYKITCEETNGNTGDADPVVVDESLFPRRKPTVAPNGYILYDAQDVDLNALFPTFNGWAFQDQDAPSVELNLFQAGGKQNHGYVQKDKDGLIHMIFLPCQAGDDLSVYLHCFDYASQFKYATHGEYPMYSWFSMVVLPEGHKPTVSKRYSRELEDGFIEMRVASFPQTIRLINSAFPKLAALAGYRKDKQVPRGWLTYKNKILRLCSGGATVHKSDAPKGTAFDGMCQHYPADESAILVQMDVEIDSLHHLFCVAEGLLQTR